MSFFNSEIASDGIICNNSKIKIYETSESINSNEAGIEIYFTTSAGYEYKYRIVMGEDYKLKFQYKTHTDGSNPNPQWVNKMELTHGGMLDCEYLNSGYFYAGTHNGSRYPLMIDKRPGYSNAYSLCIGEDTYSSYPIEITKGYNPGSFSRSTAEKYDNTNNHHWDNQSINTFFSSYMKWGIWNEHAIYITSDERIKKNFIDLNDYECLQKIKQLKPYQYQYIDEIGKGTNYVYGFKAQEVINVINNAVALQIGDTHNIYSNCNIIDKGLENNNAIIEILDIENYELLVNDILNIKLENSVEGTSIFSTITNIDGNNITVDTSFDCETVFIYGKKVDDFHVLNTNRIIPVNVAAIQEIDRRVVSHFTGSHSSFPTDETIDYSTKIGQIVVSTGDYKINHNGIEYTGQNAIMIDHATPQFELSNADNQKSVIGIISRVNDDTSILINTSGEGSIWVCSYGGNLENGDYLASCVIEGYGSKQNDDLKHNYTVAKITCNVDFTGDLSGFENSSISYDGIEYKTALVGCIYQIG